MYRNYVRFNMANLLIFLYEHGMVWFPRIDYVRPNS